jgi:hypothetical protein
MTPDQAAHYQLRTADCQKEYRQGGIARLPPILFIAENYKQ